MTLYFPDASSWDAGISLSGALAVCVKATQGTWYVNPFYEALKAEAVRAGAFFTAYHFLEEGNAAAQAAHARSVIGSTPAAVDFEPVDPGAPPGRAAVSPLGVSYPALADCCGFIDAYRAAGGVTRTVYLPRWYWARSANGLNGAPLGSLIERGMLLWSSTYTAYTDATDGPGWLPYGGMAPVFWQYTSTLPFGGLPAVDFSAFKGRYPGKQDAASVAACLGEFRSLVTTGRYPPAPDPVPTGETAVPGVRGMTAARAHQRVSAAHLVADTAGVPASAIVTGTAPDGGTAVPAGTTVAVHAAPAPELEENAAGPWAGIAQLDLNKTGAHLAVDSRFGPATYTAVLAFQRSHGLTADGVIGKNTWAALGAL